MNLDRPLDDLVKESLAAKRAERTQQRKPFRGKRLQTKKNISPSNGPSGPPPATASDPPRENSPETRTDKLNPRRRGAGIGKKRRQRKRSPDGVDRDADVRPTPTAGPPSHGSVITAYPRGKAVKVVVSNLHPGVTQSDIAELFETVGPLKSATLNRYPNGTSACEAEVVFENMPDALEAIKRYNMVPLDNQPLHITLVTTRTQQTRRAPQKKPAPGEDGYRSPDAGKPNGFEDRSPDRGTDRGTDRGPPRRRQGRRKRFNRPEDRRQDDRRQDDRRQDDRRQDDRRIDDRRDNDRRNNDHRNDDRRPDDRQERDRDMYVD